jgi:hypothetical protein
MNGSKSQLELDRVLRRLASATRILPFVTAADAGAERERLIRAAARGEPLAAQFRLPDRALPREAWAWLDRARVLARGAPASALYEDRLDELEVELALIEALGDTKRVRALAARRFGTGSERVPTEAGPRPLRDVATHLLATVDDYDQPRTLPANAAKGRPSACAVMEAVARRAGLTDIEVRVEPRLAAGAAAGERTVLLSDRSFGVAEARRLAVHEVLGHLVAAANARAQPSRLLEAGTAGSFADQEGLAIALEERAGLLDGRRIRTLAARVLVTCWLHEGRSFSSIVQALMQVHGFPPSDAVRLSERAFRGGGVARDHAYLAGFLRVRRALDLGQASVDELRMGRASVGALPTLRRLLEAGAARPACYRPSLTRSLPATDDGTSFEMSPPSLATSLTRLDAT